MEFQRPGGGPAFKGLAERMKIFIDSADMAEIRDAAAMGVIDGVTTNPSLVAKIGRSLVPEKGDVPSKAQQTHGVVLLGVGGDLVFGKDIPGK